MARSSSTLLVALVVLMVGASCGSGASSSSGDVSNHDSGVVRVSRHDSGSTVGLRVGDTLIVSLNTSRRDGRNLSAGWFLAHYPQHLLKRLSSEGNVLRFRFRAIAQGRGSIGAVSVLGADCDSEFPTVGGAQIPPQPANFRLTVVVR
jgi:hypothetical protein